MFLFRKITVVLSRLGFLCKYQIIINVQAELAKLQSDTAAPSSLAEMSPDQEFADLDAKLKAQQEKTQKELDALNADDSTAADPSSFVEEGAPDSFADLDAKLKVRGN